MKKKYQVMLVVLGVLIAFIGLSYAYYVAITKVEGTGGSVEVTTVTIDKVGLNIEGKISFNDLDIYPGHKNISKIKVEAIGNDDTIVYKLVWEGINGLSTPLKYYVYETTSDEAPSISCNKKEQVVGASRQYFEECTNNNFDNLGNIISQGEITSSNTKNEYALISNQVIKGTKTGNVIYYYVVLEYPNLDTSQNIDMNKSFDGIITAKEEENTLADITIKKMYVKNNNTYEETKTMPSDDYIIDEEQSTCSNNAKPKWKNNKVLITNLTSSNTECNLYFKNDDVKPVISDVATLVTGDTITVTIAAIDNVEVTEYYFAIDNGEFIKETANTHVFNNLNVGSTHTIKVYVKDKAGNQSEISTKENVTTTPDSTKPTITNVTTSVTKTTIGVTVTANDSGTPSTGVAEYWYQINSETPVKGTGNTHTFNNLNAGTTYTVKVYVKDGAGNQSDTTTKSATTTSLTEETLAKLNITNYSTTQPDFSQISTTDEGIFRTSDGMYGGYSYYWRGAVEDNHVIFAGYCWRIIRINGDGTIRMIYNGDLQGTNKNNCLGNGAHGTAVQLPNTSAYNRLRDRKYYVGWTYATAQRTLSGTASTIKQVVEDWYKANLIDKGYDIKVATGKYCNDRNLRSGYSWESSDLYYAPYERMSITNQQTLSCNSGDIYQVKIGLITVDEAKYAGGGAFKNESYWLRTGGGYWTMSPSYYVNSARVYNIESNGTLNCFGLTNEPFGVRPVINLSTSATFSSGNGESSSPYVVAN